MGAVADNWIWILDVVFGAIISLGYERLLDALRELRNVSMASFWGHIVVSSCFLAFAIYDVTTFHILTHRFPYKIETWSALRYSLDLIMAFMLMLIILRGVGIRPEESAIEILCALSCWHIGAMLWHFAAALEYEGHTPRPGAFLPHLAFIGLYWTGLGAWWLIARWRRTSFVFNSRGFLRILAALVLFVSIFRYAQIINLFVNDKNVSAAPAAPGSDHDVRGPSPQTQSSRSTFPAAPLQADPALCQGRIDDAHLANGRKTDALPAYGRARTILTPLAEGDWGTTRYRAELAGVHDSMGPAGVIEADGSRASTEVHGRVSLSFL